MVLLILLSMLCNSGLGFIKIKAVKKVRAQRRNEFMTIV